MQPRPLALSEWTLRTLSVAAVATFITSCASTALTPGAARPSLSLPDSASLAVTDMDGVRHDLDTLLEHGTPVTLVFWQTWCASCLREAPQLAEAARALNGRMAFFGVVSGPEGTVNEVKVRQAVKKYQTPYPQVRDRELQLTRACEVRGTPTLVVLGRGRRVLYTGHRPPADWSELASSR